VEFEGLIEAFNTMSNKLRVNIDHLEDKIEKRTSALKKALDEVNTLEGILPFCSFCKKIRKDDGYWERVDRYIAEHSDASISHSICPECAQKEYPEMYEMLKSSIKEDAAPG
jgi:hypothetical protein